MTTSVIAPAETAHNGPLTLDEREHREVAALAEALVATPPGLIDDPAWLATARVLSCRLPAGIREAVRRFRHDPGVDGTLLISGLPIDAATLPATPTVVGSVQRTATVPAATAVLVGLALGELIAYRGEKGGALVQDVLPVPGLEHSQSNAGSQPLQLHVENAFHALRPDYVGLTCLRNSAAEGGTLVVSMRRAASRISTADLTVLSQPRFRTAAPPSFHRDGGAAEHAVLTGCPVDPDVRLDLHATRALDDEADRSLARLRTVLEEGTTSLVLRPGELAFLDNRVVLHGRSRFAPRYDGTDRWLQRIYIRLDHRRSRAARIHDGAVLS